MLAVAPNVMAILNLLCLLKLHKKLTGLERKKKQGQLTDNTATYIERDNC